MTAEVTASTEVVLPVSAEEAWSVLSDTPRMIALDPLLDRYEPECGAIEAGTLNRVRAPTEDTLEPANGGCQYRVMITVTPTLPLFGPPLARVMIRAMVAGRRRFMKRLHTAITEE